MASSPDDLSKFVVKTEITPEKMQQIADGLAAGEKGGGTIFEPMEAVAAGIRAGNMLAEFFKVIGIALARGFIMPVELVLRRNFGERYFNGSVFVAFLFLYEIFRWFFKIQSASCKIIISVALIFLVINRALIYARNRRGEYWHSYSEGESRLRLPILDKWLAARHFTFDASKLLLEPAVVCLFSPIGFFTPSQRVQVTRLLDYYYFNPVVWYLLIAGVVMFVYQLGCYMYRYDRYLDGRDSQVEAEVRGILNATEQKPGVGTHKGLTYLIMGGKSEPKH